MKNNNYLAITANIAKKKGLTEEQADNILEPYLIDQAEKIKNGEIETYTWEEAKKKLEEEE